MIYVIHIFFLYSAIIINRCVTQAFHSKSIWFDFFVVTVSLVDLILASGGTNFNFMRLFRIFRVVRVFNKFEDMRRILTATLSAFGPVLNAFLLFGVINSIYAVLGVTLFQEKDHENFMSFSLCFYTLLGITTVCNGYYCCTLYINSIAFGGSVLTNNHVFFRARLGHHI